MPSSNRILLSKIMSGPLIQQVGGLKAMAFADYKAARVLFNAGCLQQACSLANTCIEKELKAYLLCYGCNIRSLRHNSLALYKEMLKVDPDMANIINESFITALNHIYKSRYYDAVTDGYSYVINQNKFLAELDLTYTELEDKSHIYDNTKQRSITQYYQSALQRKDCFIYQNNYLLNGLSKDNFLAQRDYVNELRVISNTSVMSTEYYISHNPDQIFTHEGLTKLPTSSDGSSQLRPFYWEYVQA